MDTQVVTYKIIGTNIRVYEAYVKDDPQAPYQGSHTFTYIEDKKWIKIGTDPRQTNWRSMPTGEQRITACFRDFEQRKQLAVKMILEKYPHLLDIEHKICDSSIETYCE
ncbi:MAG: hypothetical protein E6R03_09095 [Hyphomicrobiaceae bacterium]|nr:MAG: hypothetical protein E6R03_09095 [Hyphomicrobiaceae bacterium]